MIGRVISTKMKNTATVLVERTATHPLYKKTYARSKKYLVADSIGVKMGDVVDFIKCKPVSRRKHWKVVKVLGKSFAEIAEGELKKEAEEIISEVMPERVEEPQENSENKVVMDNSTKKPKSKKGDRTELSK